MRIVLVIASVVALLSCAGCAGRTATEPAPPSSSSQPSPSQPSQASPGAGQPSASPAASMPTAEDFVSTQYDYSAGVPAGAEIAAATTGWDGGDVDHTAAYADRLYGDGWVIFVLGTPTDRPLAGFVDDHVAWLTANRGCPAPSTRADSTVDGVPAVRLAFHCPGGIYGATLVDKVIAVRDGKGIIWTSMSPDTGAEELAAFDQLVASVRWAGS